MLRLDDPTLTPYERSSRLQYAICKMGTINFTPVSDSEDNREYHCVFRSKNRTLEIRRRSTDESYEQALQAMYDRIKARIWVRCERASKK